MRVALLGAAGIIGRDIARYLVAGGQRNLLLADLRREPVQALAKELEVEGAPVDVTDTEAAATLLKGCDLILNATLYYFNLQVMEACLAAGCNYLDLGGLYHTTLKQLQFDRRFRAAGLLGILGCGKAPGITNVLAAWGTPRFEALEAVHLRSGRRPLGEAKGVRLAYSAQTLFDEFTLRPVVFKDRKPREVEPLSGREVVRHPEPFGEIEYITTLHSELATLPGYLGKGLQTMEFKVALQRPTAEVLELLIALGFASQEPMTVGADRISPREVTVAILSNLPQEKIPEIWITEVEMVGEGGGGPLRVVLRVTGDERHNGTALSAVAGAKLMGTDLAGESGVFAPEAVIPPGEFLRLLRAAGLGVSETMVETRGLGS